MNLTESENKALIRVSNAIKDPDKAAAELQARRLLSCSTVESLLTSPKSQQEKAIIVFLALHEEENEIISCQGV